MMSPRQNYTYYREHLQNVGIDPESGSLIASQCGGYGRVVIALWLLGYQRSKTGMREQPGSSA
jgi:topoisomerase IA-like protein